MFITFEGIDGSGKTTQSKAINAYLREQGYTITFTREPGGTDIGNQVRGIVLDNLNNTDMNARTELLLFCASRAQLVHELIMPTLERGEIVLCDRYADSTLAYQGYGHGLPIADLEQILEFATSGLKPDITIYLDMSPDTGLKRRQKRLFEGEEWNRLDALEMAFHERVHAGYESIIEKESSKRWLRIDANRDAETITQDIIAQLTPFLPQSAK